MFYLAKNYHGAVRDLSRSVLFVLRYRNLSDRPEFEKNRLP